MLSFFSATLGLRLPPSQPPNVSNIPHPTKPRKKVGLIVDFAVRKLLRYHHSHKASLMQAKGVLSLWHCSRADHESLTHGGDVHFQMNHVQQSFVCRSYNLEFVYGMRAQFLEKAYCAFLLSVLWHTRIISEPLSGLWHVDYFRNVYLFISTVIRSTHSNPSWLSSTL